MIYCKLFRLNFKGNPVHFGELGIGMEETSDRIHSDTLFSAWVSAYARLFGKDAVEELLKKFQADVEPLFRLSSTFLYHIRKKQSGANQKHQIQTLCVLSV